MVNTTKAMVSADCILYTREEVIMQKRHLGRTGLEVSVIGFGGIKLSLIAQDEADEVLNRALDLGIDFFDTARGYKDSENRIGAAIGHRREEFVLCSRAAPGDAEEMQRAVEASLSALGTEWIDIYQFHNMRRPEQYELVMRRGGGLEGLRKMQEQGLIRHIGFSSHRYLDTMKQAIRSGEFDVITVAYNILNDEMVDEEVLPLARECDVGVEVMKPLAGGTLAAPPEDLQFAPEQPISAFQALRFVLANDAVTAAIPGMAKISELEENVRAGEGIQALSATERQELVRAGEAVGREFCRNCWYCQPCPEGILIPNILRQLGYHKRYGLEEWAAGRYSMLEIKPTACTECGECEEKCPYDLPIREMLKESAALFES